jgi:hypothetical protein
MIVASSSGSSKKQIKVFIENASDGRQSIEVGIYLNGSLMDTKRVDRDTLKISYASLDLNLPGGSKQSVIQFKIPKSGEVAECSIDPDSLSQHSRVRVVLIETVFKKGWRFNTVTLDKDSIVRKDFDCQVIYNPPAYKPL